MEFTGASQGSSGNGYTFALKEGATVSADCGLFGFLDIASPAEPEDRAGFVFRHFDDGAVFVDQLGTYPWAANWRWNVDGCLVEDCARFVNLVSDSSVKKDGLVTLSRSFVRLPSSTAPGYVEANLPMIEAEIDGNSELGLRLEGIDIRPSDQVGGTSLVTFRVASSESAGALRIENSVFEGRDRGASTAGVGFKGAGIEVLAQARAGVEFLAKDVVIRDAFGDGILAVVEGGIGTGDRTVGTLELDRCEISECGLKVPASPYLSSAIAEFSRSGVHIAVGELGRWSSTKIDSSEVRSNYRHGVHYRSRGRFEYSPGFPLCEILETQIVENGLVLDPLIRGDGVHCALFHDSMTLGMSRCLLRGNQSAGIFANVDSNDEQYPDYFRLLAVNSVMTENKGVRGDQQIGNEYRSPICVTYTEAANASGWLKLSGVTVTANIAPYGLAVFAEDDLSYSRTELLGSGATVIENSVFRENVPTLGSEQSFFPLPMTPIWDALWAQTFNCCLVGDPAFYQSGVRNNLMVDPDLRMYTAAGVQFGTTFPCTPAGGCATTSPLIDAGRAPGVPQALGTDIRGFSRPGSTPGDVSYDIGAFEVQGGE